MALQQRQATTGLQVGDMGLCIVPSPPKPSNLAIPLPFLYDCMRSPTTTICSGSSSCIYPGVSFLSSYSPYNLLIHG
jgi:hypothetical protein